MNGFCALRRLIIHRSRHPGALPDKLLQKAFWTR
jgi:hypothetical protein